MRRSCLIAVSLLVAGCAISRPYFEVGVGYKVHTSLALDPRCDKVTISTTSNLGRAGGVTSCGGRNPTAHLGAGVEFKPGSRVARFVSECGWSHWSHWRDGWPFTDPHIYRELYSDELVCKKRWGGYR